MGRSGVKIVIQSNWLKGKVTFLRPVIKQKTLPGIQEGFFEEFFNTISMRF